MPEDVEGRLHPRVHASRHLLGLVVVLRLLDQDCELVPAEAGDGVRGAHALVEALGHLAQEVVAGRVAQGVVDRLEVVEIDEQDRHPPAVTPSASQGVAHAVLEQGAVWQLGQRVVEGLMAQLVLERGALAHVAHGHHEAVDRRVVAEVEPEDLRAARRHAAPAPGRGPCAPASGLVPVLGLGGALERGAQLVAVLGVGQVGERGADDRAGLVAEHPL